MTENAINDNRFEQFLYCFSMIFGVDPGVLYSEYQTILRLVDPVSELRKYNNSFMDITYIWKTVQPDIITMCGRNG